jgi:DNA polymerase-3 subunit gamma/tau
LGFAGVEVLKKTICAISTRDPRLVLGVVDDLTARGHDLRNFCRDVLGLFRDLLVFKVAGEDAGLYDGAVFSPEDMRSLAGPFSEEDLVRFFNSLCETEASLREAAHPRYVLEIGLVKLIEMRSVASIESILERLDALSAGRPLPAKPVESLRAAASADISSEKKTLKTEPPARVARVAHAQETERFLEVEPPDDAIGADAFVPEPNREAVFEPSKEPVPVFAAPPIYPVRLPPLSSLDLEHVDDTKLDDAYEEMLAITGDDLQPIAGVEKIAEALIGRAVTTASNGTGANGSSGAAAARAYAPPVMRPVAPSTAGLPKLSDDPTEEELRAYAEAHPSVQAAMRIFKAKIVSVTKR